MPILWNIQVTPGKNGFLFCLVLLVALLGAFFAGAHTSPAQSGETVPLARESFPAAPADVGHDGFSPTLVYDVDIPVLTSGPGTAPSVTPPTTFGYAAVEVFSIRMHSSPCGPQPELAEFVAAEETASLAIPANSTVGQVLGKVNQYPEVLDPRTGRNIPFPSGVGDVVSQAQRVPALGATERGDFISEWYQRGYSTPNGGWDIYDIHHILPREYGGGNDFWNLVPVERQTHQELFNSFWRDFNGL